MQKRLAKNSLTNPVKSRRFVEHVLKRNRGCHNEKNCLYNEC